MFEMAGQRPIHGMEEVSRRAEALGGGSAQVQRSHVTVAVAGPESEAKQAVRVNADGESLQIEHPRAQALDRPETQASRVFRVHHAMQDDGRPTNALVSRDGSTGQEALNTLLANQSALVLSLGQTSSGKTFALHSSEWNLSEWLLRSLFDHLSESESHSFRIAVSLYDIAANDRCSDLLATQYALATTESSLSVRPSLHSTALSSQAEQPLPSFPACLHPPQQRRRNPSGACSRTQRQ